MFGIESIFQGKTQRSRHSWLTCITQSPERARDHLSNLPKGAIEQRLFEFDASGFPVYFVGGSLDYTFTAEAELIAKLSSAPIGMPESILFNIYRFSEEYVWGEKEFCTHYHIDNESLVEFRAGRGALYAAVHGDDV